MAWSEEGPGGAYEQVLCSWPRSSPRTRMSTKSFQIHGTEKPGPNLDVEHLEILDGRRVPRAIGILRHWAYDRRRAHVVREDLAQKGDIAVFGG